MLVFRGSPVPVPGVSSELCHIEEFFGPDCADRINDTCDRCNNINGSCDSGCNPGWQGLECQDGN